MVLIFPLLILIDQNCRWQGGTLIIAWLQTRYDSNLISNWRLGDASSQFSRSSWSTLLYATFSQSALVGKEQRICVKEAYSDDREPLESILIANFYDCDQLDNCSTEKSCLEDPKLAQFPE